MKKTGNPFVDNLSRKHNRELLRVASSSFTVQTPRGRRRKKYIKNKELPRMMELIYAVVVSKHER